MPGGTDLSQQGPTTLEDAQAAIDLGDWDAAVALLVSGAVPEADAPATFELLALAHYGAGNVEACVAAFERLHALHAQRGETIEAARAAALVAMYLMMDSGLMSPVRGWLAKVDRLLDGLPDTPVHAVQSLVRMYERFMCGDLVEADRWSRRSIELGDRHDVLAASTLGRVCQARVRIFGGEMEAGLAQLDEVATVLHGGELESLPTGMVWCELICAVQGLAQYDRVTEWTEAYEHWRHGKAVGGIHGRCRVHRAEVLRMRGSCDEAEQEALEACEALRPWMRREFGWPLTELGTIRLRRGDLAGAEEAFLAAHQNAWDPQPGLALVRLAQGRVEDAAGMLAVALDRPSAIPSKERPPFGPLRRAPLLDAQSEIAARAGDVPTADLAAEELADIRARFPGPAFTAIAALARARCLLLHEDPAGAIDEARIAVANWAEIGAPWETAAARLVLSRAHERAGNGPDAELEREAARNGLDEIGGAHWDLDDEGVAGAPTSPRVPTPPEVPTPPKGSADDVFRCEGDVRTIAFAGRRVQVKDLKGLRHLARLLAEPGREFHALDLVGVEEGRLPTARHAVDPALTEGGVDGVGPLLDDEAKAAFRRRLAEVDEDIEEAERHNDPARAELARRDRDYLVAELRRAVGLAGRDRTTGSNAERARTTVTRALRYGLDRVREHHPELADHLDATVRTGIYCAYEPDPLLGLQWET